MILRVALALVAGVAAADAPAYYAGPAHALMVRDAPGGRIIGELPAGASPLEVAQTTLGGAWGRIAFGEVNGWVALDALTAVEPAALPYAALPDGLLCAGVEPFWSLRLGPDGATYAAPDAAARAESGMTASTAEGRPWPAMLRFTGLTAIIRPAACSDGMSNRIDPWTVDVLMDDALRTGCCRLPLTH
jgi:uncharacterized membrane protein